MQKNNLYLLMALMLIIMCLSGCAKDLIIDYGKGDSIRLVGGADNFDCDDPAYANVKKVRTWTMQFADGSTKFLCKKEGASSTNNPAPPVATPPVASPSPTNHSTFKWDALKRAP